MAGELQSQNFGAMCNSGGRGSDRDLFDFVGFGRSLNLPVHAKIDFAVLLANLGKASTCDDQRQGDGRRLDWTPKYLKPKVVAGAGSLPRFFPPTSRRDEVWLQKRRLLPL